MIGEMRSLIEGLEDKVMTFQEEDPKEKKDERLENLRLKDQSNEFGDQELLNLYLNHEWMFWDRKYKETEKQKTELLVTPT